MATQFTTDAVDALKKFGKQYRRRENLPIFAQPQVAQFAVGDETGEPGDYLAFDPTNEELFVLRAADLESGYYEARSSPKQPRAKKTPAANA